MTLQTAETIYKTKYAAKLRYDDLPPGVDACLLDYGINSGDSRAILVIRALVKVPGSNIAVDQPLLDAIKKADPVILINAVCDERLHFMHGIRGGSAWAEFGGGWGTRVADLRTYCAHLAQNGAAAAAPAPADLSHTVQPKAKHEGDTAPKSTAGGAVSAGTAAHLAGFNWYNVLGVVVLAVVAGVIYEAISASKASAANNTVVLPPNVVLPTIPAVPAAA